MRTGNSIKNSIIAVFANFFAILIGFIAQKIFINIIGAEYLGVNGLFTNIISILSISELGIGEAIIYNLYKPIAQNDRETIKSLLLFYKKAYRIISIFVLIAGLCVIPFLHLFIGETTLSLNFTFVYILFVLQTVASYVLTYKRSVLYANQKNYIINIIHIAYLIVMNISQLLILYITKNYYLYLIIKIVCVILENVVINIFANKLYDYASEKNVKKLDKNIQKDIFKRIKAQFFHKIGWATVNGTDNIIISKFLGVITVGLYSNYYLVINSVKNLFSQFILATTASVGNLLVEDDLEKSYSVYKNLRFFNFWIATFSAVAILVIMQSFVVIWVGKEYLLTSSVIYILVFNYYQNLMRSSNDVFLTGAGICVENRFVPLVEALLNIIFSIILVKFLGLTGVFVGTAISGLALWAYSYPKFVYKKLFHRSYRNYAKETIGYIILFIIIAIITNMISINIIINNVIVQFIINVAIGIIFPNLILFIIFRKSDEFQYFINLFKNMILSKLKQNKQSV